MCPLGDYSTHSLCTQKHTEAVCCVCCSRHLLAAINTLSGFLQQDSLIRTLVDHLIGFDNTVGTGLVSFPALHL